MVESDFGASMITTLIIKRLIIKSMRFSIYAGQLRPSITLSRQRSPHDAVETGTRTAPSRSRVYPVGFVMFAAVRCAGGKPAGTIGGSEPGQVPKRARKETRKSCFPTGHPGMAVLNIRTAWRRAEIQVRRLPEAREPGSGPGEAGFQSVAIETFFRPGWRRSGPSIRQLRGPTAPLLCRSGELAMTFLVSNH